MALFEEEVKVVVVKVKMVLEEVVLEEVDQGEVVQLAMAKGLGRPSKKGLPLCSP